jgi:flagellar motor switch protein FliN
MDSQQLVEQQEQAISQEVVATGGKDKDLKIDLLFDLSLQVSIELGRTKMLIKDILELQRGSIIELEKLASEPVDILINGKKVAEGEVVVIEKHFGIRITSLIDSSERLKNIGG